MSLVENFKDRVPTQVLQNGAIRYETFNSNGVSQGYIWIKRADEPTEEGNIWNKVIYDGIKEAIEELISDKLDIASKATASDATTGTNDTKYMTPSKTKSAITNYKATEAQAKAGTDDTKYITSLKLKQAILNGYIPSKQMSIKTGTVSDGGTITQTSGYSNYIYFVSPKMDSYTFVNAYNSYEVSGAGFRVDCSVDQSTRKVTAKAYVEVRSSAGGITYTNYESIKANYLEIAYN